MDNNEHVGLKGVYTVTVARPVTSSDWALHDLIANVRAAGGAWLPLVRELNARCATRRFEVSNLVPTVGRAMIANNLTDATPTNAMRINYVALGSNVAAPANGDTTLGTETYRNEVASETNSDNIAYVTGFFTALEVDGTFKEAGLFSDGTGTVDTGVLFSHVAIDVTKSDTETLTIDWTLTLS